MTDRILVLLLGLLTVGSVWSGAGPAVLLAAAAVPLALVVRSTGPSQLPRGWVLALGVPLVGSLVWLLLDRPGPGEPPGSLRRAAVLFGGFYLLPLVLSSLAFARAGDRPRDDSVAGAGHGAGAGGSVSGGDSGRPAGPAA